MGSVDGLDLVFSYWCSNKVLLIVKLCFFFLLLFWFFFLLRIQHLWKSLISEVVFVELSAQKRKRVKRVSDPGGEERERERNTNHMTFFFVGKLRLDPCKSLMSFERSNGTHGHIVLQSPSYINCIMRNFRVNLF